MESVLIVAGADKSIESLRELILQEYPAVQAETATNAGLARRLLAERDYDLILVSAPLTDENGILLSTHAASDTDAGVILLVKSENADEIAERVGEHGVFVVEKPIGRSFFSRALKLVLAARNRMRILEQEKRGLQVKVEDIKLLSRAMVVLMQYLTLSEPQAHRYIEKQAMDMRISKREVAESILKKYEY